MRFVPRKFATRMLHSHLYMIKFCRAYNLCVSLKSKLESNKEEIKSRSETSTTLLTVDELLYTRVANELLNARISQGITLHRL